MSLDTTVSEFVHAQEEKEFTTETLRAKLDSVTQEVTIREVGLYHHPTMLFRDSESQRLLSHVRCGGSIENFQRLGTFEYEATEYPTVPARVSLLGFVLSEDTDYDTEDFERWMNQNHLVDEEFDAFTDWCEDEANSALQEIYHNQSDAIWKISEGTSYEQGVLSPLLSVVVLFEDEAGVFYTGLLPVDTQQDEVKELLATTLEEVEVEVESEEPTESDDAETSSETDEEEDADSEMKTEYQTVDTTAKMQGGTLNLNNTEIGFECILPPTWYSTPFLSHAFDAVTEQSYELIQTLEDGWYEATAVVDTGGVHSQNQVHLSLPYDSVSIPWDASLEDGHITRELFAQTDESDSDSTIEEIDVKVRSFFMASEEIVGETYATSRNSVWVICPESVGTETTTNDESEQQEQSEETKEETEKKVNDSPDGILERLGIR